MRVAVLSCFNGIWNGGGESWSLDLCRHLQRQGHTCLLIQGGATAPADVAFRIVTLGVATHDHAPPRRPGFISKVVNRCYLGPVDRDVARIALRALPHLIAFRPHIIVPVNNFWSVIAAKGARLCARGRARVVVTGHTKGWSRVERDTMRLGIDGFVAPQPRAYEGARAFARGRTPVRLIPNGVDLAHFESGPAAPVPLDPPIALVVSSLLDYKRVDLAVRGAARAGLSLLILGDGPNANRVDTLGRSLLGSTRFLRIPYVPHDDVAAYYRAAHVFTLPSDQSETFGIVILEALAAGLPVVVGDDPVRRWIVGDGGLFVDPRDSARYAQALRCAAARRRHVPREHLARFGWPVVASEYAAFFAQLCAQETRWR